MAVDMVMVNSRTDNACASAIFRSRCPKAVCACVSRSVDEAVQFPVQCPVAVAQAVGVGIHFRCLPLLDGYQAVAELVQFLGGGQYLHRFLASEEPCDTFLLLRNGVQTGGTFRHFGQVIYQEAVRLVLTGKDFRQVQQVGFLFRQEGAQGVYRRAR